MTCAICGSDAEELIECHKCKKKVCYNCVAEDDICDDCYREELEKEDPFDPQGEIDMMYPEGMDDGEYIGDED
jgi:hypothetical protein